MRKALFWFAMVFVVVFGVLAATRTIWQDPGEQRWAKKFIKKINALPKESNQAYEQSCRGCHMLYAPAMLPARSWRRIMSDLSNHFGDDAEVQDDVRKEITDYLVRNAAERDPKNVYAEPMLNLLKPDETPLRISDTTYFKLMHDFVKPAMVQGNPDVKTFANCEACHYEALQGRFNRKAVIIPNYHLDRVGVWKKGKKPVFHEKEIKTILE